MNSNSMLQEQFLHLATHKLTTVVTAQAIRCSPNQEQRLQRPDDVKSSQRTPARNPAEFVHYRQKFLRLAIFRPLKDEIIAPHMARIPRFRYLPPAAAGHLPLGPKTGDPVSKAKYTALRTRGHRHAKALRSVADRLLKFACVMLKNQQLFDHNYLKHELAA